MAEKTDIDCKNAGSSGVGMAASEVVEWFVREVLPLEAILMHFLRHNWRDQSDIEDLRQEVYVRVCEAAQKQLPEQAKPFVLMTARNLAHRSRAPRAGRADRSGGRSGGAGPCDGCAGAGARADRAR